jgi:hypothetical protein
MSRDLCAPRNLRISDKERGGAYRRATPFLALTMMPASIGRTGDYSPSTPIA